MYVYFAGGATVEMMERLWTVANDYMKCSRGCDSAMIVCFLDRMVPSIVKSWPALSLSDCVVS